MYRMLFALPIFAVMAWWASRGKPPLTRQDWLGIVGLGFTGYYLASFLDFAGLVYISASLERLILYLNPGQLHLPPSLQPQQRFPVTGDAVSSFAATSQAAFEVLLVLTQQRQRELSDQREVARRMP